ncbi:hypothetical protein [Halocatena marina]|nr:hypothetical protein [Halocatena marina]
MPSIDVKSGQVTITDEAIQIDTGPFGGLKRLFEQSTRIKVFFIGSSIFLPLVFIFDPAPLTREMAQFAIVFAILGLSLGEILPRLMNTIATESELPRSVVDRVEYTTGSRLRAPKLRIIATYGTETGVRPVHLSPLQLGGGQQLEAAIEAFEDAGITIVPAPEET